MKKKYFLFPILMLASICMIGQPTLTFENNTPQIGDVYYQSYSNDFVNPGPQGPNKTWNFSELSVFETGEFIALDPADTPFADIFTDANIAYNYSSSRSETYNYGKITSSEANNLGTGFDNDPPMVIYYDDYAKLMEYPCTFNDNFTDNYSGGYEMEGMLVKQNGTIEKIADAWGTITTPAGTFENVLRLKTTRNEIDSTWMEDIFLWRTVTQFKDYEWYANDSKVPVFAITISSSTMINDTVSYFTTGMTSLPKDQAKQNILEISPNPATESLNIKYYAAGIGPITVSLFDLTGKEIIDWKFTKSFATIVDFRLDISGIPAGMYLIRINNYSETVSRKLIIK